jgi:hypothetical protein
LVEDGDGGVEDHVEYVTLEDDGRLFVDAVWLDWTGLTWWW